MAPTTVASTNPARPLHWLGACDDPRYPALAGPWAVGCGPSGRVDRAEHLATGEQVRLQGAVTSPGLAEGLLYAPGVPSRVWRLPSGAPERVDALPGRVIAPPATDGAAVVVSLEGGLTWQQLGINRRSALPGTPAPWYPPAVTGEWVAWVSVEQGAEVLMAWRRGMDDTLILDSHASHGGHPRHAAASAGWIGWIRDDAVVLWSSGQDRRRIETDAHTSRRLAMWEEVACWESWNGGDVDAVCSDGVTIGGEGHQRGPDRWDGWLLYVEDGRTMVADVGAR